VTRRLLLLVVLLIAPCAIRAQSTFNNLDDSYTSWQYSPPCYGTACAGGTGTASSFVFVIDNSVPSLDGQSLKIGFTGPTLTDGETTNVLWPRKVGANNSATWFVGTWAFYLPSTSNITALEVDQFQFNSGQRFMFGTECDLGAFLRIWNQLTTSWVATTVACPVFTTNTWHTGQFVTHRVPGDTSCASGNPCMHFDTFTMDGVVHNLNLTEPSAPSSDPDNTGFQFQIDMNASGGNVLEYLDLVDFSEGTGAPATGGVSAITVGP